MSTQIGRTVLLTRDPDATAAFYRDAFGFSALYDSTARDFRFLHIGPGGMRDPGLWLMPAADNPTTGAQGGGGPLLVLYVDDLAATLERLAQLGVTPAAPPVADPESDQTYAEVVDPDGNGLILVEFAEADEPGRATADHEASRPEPSSAPTVSAPTVSAPAEATPDEIATIPDIT